jgi:hypothetical protein
MNIADILESIDSEISRLQQIRSVFAELRVSNKRGRPKKVSSSTPKRRALSAEARAKIAAAQKRQWTRAKKLK